jgi:hypothetical protein
MLEIQKAIAKAERYPAISEAIPSGQTRHVVAMVQVRQQRGARHAARHRAISECTVIRPEHSSARLEHWWALREQAGPMHL